MPIHFFESHVNHPGIKLPVRCVAVQESAQLILISPIDFDDEQFEAIRGLGKVTDLVAPSLFHHLSMQSAINHFPEAKVWCVPSLKDKRTDISWTDTLSIEKWPYKAFLDVLIMQGADQQEEAEFYYRPTKTLLATDLCFNLHRTKGWAAGIALRMMGVYNGFAVSKRLKKMVNDPIAFEQFLARLFQWDFDGIVMSHGEPVKKDGKSLLRAALEERGFSISQGNLPTTLTKAEAIKLGKQVCEQEDWPWEEPVSVTAEVHDSHPVWSLKTNYMNRGRNVVIRVAKADGSILQKNFSLR